jgi:hypothetical protein
MFTSKAQSLQSPDIGRAPYFMIGATLFALKLTIDWSIAHLVFDRKWSPVEYISPGATIALLFAEPRERTFYLTMLLIALPFIARRLADRAAPALRRHRCRMDGSLLCAGD